ncbi:MAG: hypothetical protein WKG07_32500 [Hymenobacter sp.]
MNFTMSFLKADTWLDVFLHLLLIAALGAALVLGFFYVYLPITTHHGETIVVPKITGMTLADLPDLPRRAQAGLLRGRQQLRARHPALHGAHAGARARRKGEAGPQNMRLGGHAPPAGHQDAQAYRWLGEERAAHSEELRLGNRPAQDGAQRGPERRAQAAGGGKEIAPGAPIAKGTKVDLEVGDGLGNTGVRDA